MERNHQLRIALLAAVGAILLFNSRASADNPVVQHIYTADPAPMVHGDTVYLCTSHDEDVTVGGFFTMNDWRVFSSKDMVNWTDHGTPLSYQTFSWASGKAWAPHCVERGGKFYFFVPVSDSIGVAVADSPLGPFEDAIGAPLLSNYQYIDPSVFIDEDGQAYLYFGNPKLWYVKLNADMISYSGTVQAVPMTSEAFGERVGNPDRPTLYEEGPWFTRRGDLYYMMFAASGIPEDIAYSTSPGPTGPWTYRGIIMPNQAGHAFTNHAGVIDFQGRSFFFYHTQELPGGGGFKRSTAIEEFTYNSDGTFPTIPKTSEGVTEPIAPLMPYGRVEAETIAWGAGIEVEDTSDGGRNVSNIEDGDYIKVESVDFWTGAVSFEASVASAENGGTIELHLDAVDGPFVGTCTVETTGGWQQWEMTSCAVSEPTDVHDLYLVFRGEGGFLFNVDFWQFTSKDPLPDGSGGSDGAGGGPAASIGGSVTSIYSGGAGISSGGTGQGPETGGASPTSESSPSSEDPAGCSCSLPRRSSQAPPVWGVAFVALVARAGPRRRRQQV